MKKFIILIDISLSAGGDEYGSHIENVYFETVEALSENIALTNARAEITPEIVENLCDWGVGYGYYIHLKEV